MFLALVTLAAAQDDSPWTTGETWPPPADPVPAPVPAPPPVEPVTLATTAPIAMSQCQTPKRAKGVPPAFSDVALAGQGGLTAGVASTAANSGGGGIGVQFKVDCTRMELAIGVGNLVDVKGDGAADFGNAVLGLGSDSAVLAWRMRTDVGQGHGTHGGAGFDAAFFTTMSTWTDARDATAEASGATSATVWIGGANLGFDHTWDPEVEAAEPMDVRISVEGGLTTRFILDDPDTHYAGWALAYDGDLGPVVALGGVYLRPSVRVGNFEPYVDASWLFGEEIPGLSGLRLVAGTRIDGNLFKLSPKAATTRSGAMPAARAPTDNLL